MEKYLKIIRRTCTFLIIGGNNFLDKILDYMLLKVTKIKLTT